MSDIDCLKEGKDMHALREVAIWDYSFQNAPLQSTASLWKLFEILSYEILEAKFGFSTKTFVEQ